MCVCIASALQYLSFSCSNFYMPNSILHYERKLVKISVEVEKGQIQCKQYLWDLIFRQQWLWR